MIRVYWADVSQLNENQDDAVSEYRAAKLAGLKRPEARRLALGAERLLQAALKKVCPDYQMPPVICCESGGKPYLSDRRFSFNLSHSGTFAACALSEHSVGIDLQVEIKPQTGLIQRVLTPAEIEYLKSSDNSDSAFTELWCRKESFLKATGEGLSLGLRSFCTVPGQEHLIYKGNEYAIVHQRFPDFHLAVCYPKALSEDISIERIELP